MGQPFADDSGHAGVDVVPGLPLQQVVQVVVSRDDALAVLAVLAVGVAAAGVGPEMPERAQAAGEAIDGCLGVLDDQPVAGASRLGAQCGIPRAVTSAPEALPKGRASGPAVRRGSWLGLLAVVGVTGVDERLIEQFAADGAELLIHVPRTPRAQAHTRL